MDIKLSSETGEDSSPKEDSKPELQGPKQTPQSLLQRQEKFLEQCREVKVR